MLIFLFFFFVQVLGHTFLILRVSSQLCDLGLSWLGLRYHMCYQGLNPGHPHTRQMSYLLYYFSSSTNLFQFGGCGSLCFLNTRISLQDFSKKPVGLQLCGFLAKVTLVLMLVMGKDVVITRRAHGLQAKLAWSTTLLANCVCREANGSWPHVWSIQWE